MCGSLDDCDSFSDLLSDSDDDFNLSAGVLGSLSNSLRTGSTLQNALEFQLGPATHDEMNDYMLNTDDDDDTGGYSQIEFKRNCGSAISEPRSRATDALATVAPSRTQLCAYRSWQSCRFCSVHRQFLHRIYTDGYTLMGHQSHARSTY
jgi:hypothetical protein